MVSCKRCGKETVKAGMRMRAGENRQMYLCRACGYEFWEGQGFRLKNENQACPKCQGSTTRYGTGFKAGEKVRKLRCSSCGHVFLDGPIEE